VDEDLIRDGGLPAAERNARIEAGLQAVIAVVREEQGEDWAQWRWGRANAIRSCHPMASVFDLSERERMGDGGSPADAAQQLVLQPGESATK